MALQGLLTDISNTDSPYNGLRVEKYAVECADALIKELRNEKTRSTKKSFTKWKNFRFR